MEKKIVIVTGATGGIGYETALGLAKKGFRVIMACRNMEKAAIKLAEIQKESGNEDMEAIHIDLASFRSVRQFVADFSAKYTTLDVLVNNAGLYSDRKRLTEDGFEMTMGVNFLGSYLLTRLLLTLMQKTPGSRIISISSAAAFYGRINSKHPFNGPSGFRAYAASKLAQVIFTVALAEELKNADISVYAVHPGWGATNIFSGESILIHLVNKMSQKYARSAAVCAQTGIYLAWADNIPAPSGTMFADSSPIAVSNRLLKPEKIKVLMDAAKAAAGV